MKIRAARRDRKPWHTDEYIAYLESEAWTRVRAAALERAGHRCEWFWDRFTPSCEETRGLEVHHRNYIRLGREEPGDLEVLCRKHHKFKDLCRQEYERKATLKRKYGDWKPDR